MTAIRFMTNKKSRLSRWAFAIQEREKAAIYRPEKECCAMAPKSAAITAQHPNRPLITVCATIISKIKPPIHSLETVRNWQAWAPELLPLPYPSPRNNIWLKKTHGSKVKSFHISGTTYQSIWPTMNQIPN